VEDLGFTLDDATTPLSELAKRTTDGALLLRTFLDKRDHQPEPDDEEELEGLADGTPRMYPIRRGDRQRGVTWWDAKYQAVWLTAAHHAHKSGATTDSYVYFRSLQRSQLLPDRLDFEQYFTEQADAESDAIWDEVPALMEHAVLFRGVEVRGHVGRVPIGIVMTDDIPPHLYVAVSRKWDSVGVTPPTGWLFALASRCFMHEFDDVEDLPYDRAMPHRPAAPDEDVLADFVADWPPAE
jgi:hypothetical protein